MLTMFVIILCMLLVSSGAGQQWTGSATLDPNGKVLLSWKNEPGSITLEIQAPTLGYIGLGISPSGTMTDADIVTGWVANGKPELKDRYSETNVLPVIDTKQDYQLLSGSENATHTILKFKRKLKTGDTKDKEIKAGPVTLIYSFGTEDPLPGSDIVYHGLTSRGNKTITFIP